jgi:hypothetical protein
MGGGLPYPPAPHTVGGREGRDGRHASGTGVRAAVAALARGRGGCPARWPAVAGHTASRMRRCVLDADASISSCSRGGERRLANRSIHPPSKYAILSLLVVGTL